MSTQASKSKKTVAFDCDVITMAHGSGGKAMKGTIDAIFVEQFDNDELAKLGDQAHHEICQNPGRSGIYHRQLCRLSFVLPVAI